MTTKFCKFLTACICFLTASQAFADDSFSYMPEIHGVVRGRWEMLTNSGEQRFQVRNARLSIGGKIHPSISYFIHTDFCDRGSIKILDAWGRFDIVKGLNFQMGQFRMPFGVETFRAPTNYIFANRSFLGKQIMNYRAVGAKIGYTLPKTPLTLEFGVFNPNTIGDHTKWSKTVTYSGKALYNLPCGFSVSAGYASIKPASVRANIVDGYIGWQNSHLLVAGEYMWTNYCGHGFDDNHSWTVFADWHKNINLWLFNRWSIQGRYDGMQKYHNLTSLEVEPKRQRATIGTTLTYGYKAVHADIRLNYEKYFDYKENGQSPDLFVAELVVRF